MLSYQVIILLIIDRNADEDDVMRKGQEIPYIDNISLRQNILDAILSKVKSTEESDNKIMFKGERFIFPADDKIQEVEGETPRYVG